jgi:hypothetical protein
VDGRRERRKEVARAMKEVVDGRQDAIEGINKWKEGAKEATKGKRWWMERKK